MAKLSYNEIEKFDSAIDSSNGLNWSGESVRRYIEKYADIVRGMSEDKYGAVHFDGPSMTLYAFASKEDKELWLQTGDASLVVDSDVFSFETESFKMLVLNREESQNLYFATSEDTAEFTFGFLTQKKEITATEWENVIEDAIVSVSIDKGSTGTFSEIIGGKKLMYGQDMTVNIKDYISVGDNRVMVTVIGATSGAKGTLIYTANLTTMYLSPSNFSWNTPFIEGRLYSLGGVNIGGALNKKLVVKITNEGGYFKQYEKNIGTATYITNAYYFTDMEFPSAGTGVYNIEMWLDADGLESAHLSYNIICVSTEDETSAQLVCISNLAGKAVNYADNTLFQYSIYNGGAAKGTPHIKITAVVNTNPLTLIDEDLVDVNTGTILPFNFHLEVETDESDLQLTALLSYGNEQVRNFVIDNSASYPSTSGAVFYMNAANRNNSQANMKNIVNEVTKGTVACDWTNMAFADGTDGWTVDDNNRKCLALPAGTKAVIHHSPLASVGNGKTFEINFKVKNVANYNEPLITICDDASSSKFKGIKILPKKIILHSRDRNTNDTVQSYALEDEQYVNLLITIARNYKINYGNIAIIYVNGVKKCEFEFENADSWDTPAYITLGNDTSDLYVYTIRAYDSAFGFQDVMKNYIGSLNTSKDKADAHSKMYNILDDSYNVDFDKVNGIYNTMVVEMLGGAELPHYGLSKDYSAKCNFWLDILNEDSDKPAISGEYLNTKIGGQGTTSMNYFTWNLRWKDLAIRLTAKKNYASSMQSHKMGGVNAYNDLHNAVIGENEAGARVAVFQYPVYGFLKNKVEGTANQYTYTFLGLYTIGPDKGDKGTFGYSNEGFKDTAISLEGTDHSIKGVGFDYPYSELKYVDSEESICVDKGNNNYDAAWEVSVCGNKKSEADKQAYLDEEFGVAYQAVYDNSCMIKGTTNTIAEINADVSTWGSQTDTDGRPYQHYEFWIDGEYELYYLSRKTNTYVKNGVNLLNQLGLTSADIEGLTIDQKNELFISKRLGRFRAVFENYFSLDESLFLVVFLFINGLTDNFKKNFYPYKLGTLASGSRWSFRNDDLDTAFDIDNQGHSVKPSSVEIEDFSDSSRTAYIFKGEDSVLIQNIIRAYPNEMKAMGKKVLGAMYELADSGTNTIDRLMSFYEKYYWDKAQDYFTKSSYNIDAELNYEDAWPPYKKGNYVVDVHPLEQSLGDHIEAEKDWVRNRLIYVASKFGYGPFAQYNDSALGVISFRTQLAQDFTLTPAVDLYPTIHSGQSAVLAAGERVNAGESVILKGAGGSNTNVYIKGADMLSDIGDLSTLAVDAANASIAVASKRLQKIKLGDEFAENVTSNLASINIGECPSLMLVDARNLASLSGTVDLTQCPRLREAYFGGTDVRAITLANGSKLTRLQLPNTLTQISMQNLKFLEGTGLDKGNFSNVEFYRVENCPHLDAFGMLKELYYNRHLSVVELLSENITTSSCTLGSDGKWYLGTHNECHICIPLKAGEEITIEVLEAGTIPSYAFLASYNPPYSTGVSIPFASGETGRHVIEGTSVTVTASVGTNYIAFTIIDGIGASYKYKITKREYVSLASSLKNIRVIGFVYDGDATDVDMVMNLAKDIAADGSTVDYTGIDSEGTPQSGLIPIIEGTLNIAGSVYEDSAEFVREQYPNLVLNVTGGYYIRFADKAVQDICAATWGDGVGITEAQAAAVTSIGTKFSNNTEITSFNELEKFTGVTSIPSRAFYGATNLQSIDLTNIITFTNGANFKNATSLNIVLNMPNYVGVIPYGAFENTAISGIENLGSATIIQGEISVNAGGWGNHAAFRKCTNLKYANLPNTLTTIQYAAFAGCTQLTEVNFADKSSINEIGIGAFCDVPIEFDIDFPNLTGTLGCAAFQNTKIRRVLNLGSISIIDGNANRQGPYGGWEAWGAFKNCTALESVNFPPSITTIKTQAFYGCTSLEIEDLSLPNLTLIEKNAFYGVRIKKISNLGKLTVFNAETYDTQTFGDKSALTEIVFPETLTSFGDNSIRDYLNLTSVGSGVFPNVTSIGANVFYNIPEVVQSVSFPALTSVVSTSASGRHLTLSKCGFTEFHAPLLDLAKTEVYESGHGILSACPNLRVIEIGELTDIPFGFASGCTKLESVTDLSKVTIVKSTAFYNTPLMEIDLVLPVCTNVVASTAGSKDGTFYNSGILSLDAPMLTEIGTGIYAYGNKGAFQECKNLSLVKLRDVTSIGINAFYKCPNLTRVVIDNVTPPTLGGNSFAQANDNLAFYVPDSAVDTYKEASGWTTYASKIKPLSEYVE